MDIGPYPAYVLDGLAYDRIDSISGPHEPYVISLKQIDGVGLYCILSFRSLFCEGNAVSNVRRWPPQTFLII